MDLDLVQAQWTLELFPPGQIPEFAAQAMMQGFEGPNILELVSFHRPTRWDIKPEVFEAALREMGRSPLDRGQAALHLAHQVALRILRNQVSPDQGAAEIASLISRGGYPDVPATLLEFQYALFGIEDIRPRDRDRSLRVIEMAWDLVNRDSG